MVSSRELGGANRINVRERRAHAYGVHFLPGPRDPHMPNATAELYGVVDGNIYLG
jgi:hypothetical protein